jgi:hypothetical protein
MNPKIDTPDINVTKNYFDESELRFQNEESIPKLDNSHKIIAKNAISDIRIYITGYYIVICSFIISSFPFHLLSISYHQEFGFNVMDIILAFSFIISILLLFRKEWVRYLAILYLTVILATFTILLLFFSVHYEPSMLMKIKLVMDIFVLITLLQPNVKNLFD